VPLSVELKILDPRLVGWGFPHYGSKRAAGFDLHACIDEPLHLEPQAPPVLISAGFACHIGDPEWCALVLPRSGLGHSEGLVLGNTVGLIDPDYEGACLISAWNRNPVRSGTANEGILIRPGDRIAQLVFTRMARPRFDIVSEFAPGSIPGNASSAEGRQQGGFGSSGIAPACPKAACEPK
jgi:dUTP pyrophosphatase